MDASPATEADTKADGNLLSVEDLVTLFEDSEDATLQARKDAERDRDYVDNKQLTAAQRRILSKRGQPDDIFNQIKRRVNFLVGLEKQQKVDPQALPNTPLHEDDAAGCSMALRYVADAERYDVKRSAVWRNLLVEGAGGVGVSVEMGADGQPVVRIRRWAWDRIFYDPHSAEPDFSDAAYLGTVTWMDYADALGQYADVPDAKDILDSTLARTNPQDTYDDKPKFKVWADAKRRRIRIVQIWIKRNDQWFWAEFTRGGILKGGPSPYVTDKGESDCELIFQSAYVDRDNNRYGDVRELIGPQNAINKQRQKALHLLNTAQVVIRKGAGDVEKVRREAARPDATIEVTGNPNNPLNHDIQFNTRSDLASAHVALMQQDMAMFEVMGPNASMLGDKLGNAASGKAIIASQQGGVIQLSDLLDNLRDFDMRVFRAVWYRIRQFWTAAKWIRVTDDERNLKWVAVNVPREQLAALQMQNPQAAEMISGAISSVAELDVDITIDDAPDSLTPALEQFEALVNLKQYDTRGELPFRAIVAAAPNLKNKSQVLEEMDKAAEAAAQSAQVKEQIEVQHGQVTVADKAAGASLKQAQADKTRMETQLKPAEMAARALRGAPQAPAAPAY
jgi:hypothetical protein